MFLDASQPSPVMDFNLDTPSISTWILKGSHDTVMRFSFPSTKPVWASAELALSPDGSHRWMPRISTSPRALEMRGPCLGGVLPQRRKLVFVPGFFAPRPPSVGLRPPKSRPSASMGPRQGRLGPKWDPVWISTKLEIKNGPQMDPEWFIWAETWSK